MLPEAFFQFVGCKPAERHLRADTRLDAQRVCGLKRLAEENAGASIKLIPLVDGFSPRHKSLHHVRPKLIVGEQPRRAETEIARFLRGVTAGRASRVEVMRRGTETNRTIGLDVVGQTDPDRRLGAPAAFGVRVQADEVHPQLGQLGQHGAVIVEVPQVRPLRKIVKWQDAAHGKQRLAAVIQVGQLQRDSLVGDDVAIEVESYAEMLHEAINAIERAHRIAPGNQRHLLAVVPHGLEHVLLGRQSIDGRLESGVRQQCLHRCPILRADHDPLAVGVRLELVDDRQQRAGSQVEVATNLLGGEPFERRRLPVIHNHQRHFRLAGMGETRNRRDQ